MRSLRSQLLRLGAPLLVALAASAPMAGASASTMAGPAASGKPTYNSAAANAAVQEALRQAAAKGASSPSGLGGEARKPGSEAGPNALSKLTGPQAAGEEGEGEEAAGKGSEGTASTAAASSSKSTSTSVLLVIFIVAGALLIGIAYMILRDARRMAPASAALADGGSARDQAARQRKRRAKAKAARRARRRNR